MLNFPIIMAGKFVSIFGITFCKMKKKQFVFIYGSFWNVCDKNIFVS
jgi:hypothetical protein